jgi:hypothetical protein
MMVSVRPKIFGVKPLFRLPAAVLLGGWLILAMLLDATLLPAQEVVRTAAGKLEIQSFRNPEAFIQVGPFQEVLTGTADVQYTDNVDLSNTDRISDLSIHEGFGLDTIWVISHLNQINLNFAGELIENIYGNGKSQINIAISPDSKVQFQFAISNFRVRLYDEFSYVQNPTQDPTAINTANLNSLTNTIGAAVDADLERAVLTLSADYTYNDQSGQNAAGASVPTTTGTRSTFRVGSDLTFNLLPTVTYGINTSVSRTTASALANVNSFSVGPFVKGTLGKNLDFNLSAGINVVDTTPSIPLGYYFNAVVRDQIDRHLQLIASASHDLLFTTGTGLTEQTDLSLATQLNLTRVITLTGTSFVDFGDVKTTVTAPGSAPVAQGAYTQLGLEASLAWNPRKRWTTKLSYDFVRREASPASTTYIENTIEVSVHYLF